jgi:uridine kinase
MPGLDRLLGPVLQQLRTVNRPAESVVLLLDGPSGAGKSTLADAVRDAWPGPVSPILVRLDDIYPGWGGLDAAVRHIGDHLLAPRHAGKPAAWQRHDWVRNAPAEWNTVDPARPLIVEGCGALARAHTALSDVRVWLDADDGIRKQRALTRDGGAFEEHWDQWQRDWERYRLRERPDREATLRLQATPDLSARGARGPGVPGAAACSEQNRKPPH